MNYYDIYSPQLARVLNDDIPSAVREAGYGQSGCLGDDVIFRSRPNTQYVVNRNFRRHGPTSWSSCNYDPTSSFYSPDSWRYGGSGGGSLYAPVYTAKPMREPGTGYYPPVYSSTPAQDPGTGFITQEFLTVGLPKERSSRPYLNIESDPSLRAGRYSSPRESVLISEPKKEKPYFLKTVLPTSYSGGVYNNLKFPFKKYRSDFVPFAPYPRLYDSVKYAPNPDWSGYYGYRYRKARFVCDPEDQVTSRSREIERAMRDSRFREMCKGVYSSSYEDTIKSKVTSDEAKNEEKQETVEPTLRTRDPAVELLIKKSLEAETAPSEGEKQRKHLSLADKRRRNETLAIGLTNQSLLKSPDSKKSEPGSKPASETNQVEPETKHEAEKETEAPEQESKLVADPEPESEPESKVEAELTPESKLEPETAPESKLEAEPEPESKLKVEPEPTVIEAKEPTPEPVEEVTEPEPEPIDEPAKPAIEPVEESAEPATEPVEEPAPELQTEEPKESEEEARIIPIQILRNEPEALETMETSSPAEETETIGAIEDVTENTECDASQLDIEPVVETIGIIEDTLDATNAVENIGPIDDVDAHDDNTEIKIVTETTRSSGDAIPDFSENTTTKTVTKMNDDGSETIETIITEYTTTKADDNHNTVVETKVTKVTIETKGDDETIEYTEQTINEVADKKDDDYRVGTPESGIVVEASCLDYGPFGKDPDQEKEDEDIVQEEEKVEE